MRIKYSFFKPLNLTNSSPRCEWVYTTFLSRGPRGSASSIQIDFSFQPLHLWHRLFHGQFGWRSQLDQLKLGGHRKWAWNENQLDFQLHIQWSWFKWVVLVAQTSSGSFAPTEYTMPRMQLELKVASSLERVMSWTDSSTWLEANFAIASSLNRLRLCWQFKSSRCLRTCLVFFPIQICSFV